MLCAKYRDFLRWTIYQIYPRSFMDSNGDGIGDLQGIIQKLDYLKELGINAVWLCPCYKSPNDDNGYDISDYRDIMDEFGTMEDMDALIQALHARDMKLIMDLVPNHTSTSHRWFQESRKGKDNPYSDFYYWFDEKPNDWESIFRGDAWEFDPVRGQYYLHSFAISQADLNWENPAVVRAMQDIVDFWIDRGVDGFRIDVIDMISKDFSRNANGFGPRLHEFIRDLFGREKTAHLFTVGESFVRDIDEMVRHCAAERGELSTLFLFDHMEVGRVDKFTPKPDSMKSLRDHLVYWQEETDRHDLLNTLFYENHDQPAMISRIADDREKRYESATDLAVMLYLLKGVPFIYEGQEIGTTAAQKKLFFNLRKIMTALTALMILRPSMPTASSARRRRRRKRLPGSISEAATTPGIPWHGTAGRTAGSRPASPGSGCIPGIRKSMWKRTWLQKSRYTGSIRSSCGCAGKRRHFWTGA